MARIESKLALGSDQNASPSQPQIWPQNQRSMFALLTFSKFFFRLNNEKFKELIFAKRAKFI